AFTAPPPTGAHPLPLHDALPISVWVDDPHFDLGYHVRHTALPAPGDDAALRRLMSRLMGQELDRERPLWEVWFVEGLEDDRWARSEEHTSELQSREKLVCRLLLE